MARPLRLQHPGVYHVISRGNARECVFLDDLDRERFLTVLGRVVGRLGWHMIAYCLMDNHYHLCLETPEPTLARGMRDVNGAYAQSFNDRHDRVGHVFEGRYKAIIVEADGYLLEVTRYIVLNPVRAHLCQGPADWPWSSHRAMLGLSVPAFPLSVKMVLGLFGPGLTVARSRYEQFVDAGGAQVTPPGSSPNPVVTGSEAFAADLVRAVGADVMEIPRTQRAARSLEQYERDATSRDDAMRMAHASGTYSFAAIGRHFGLHYSTVSKICRGRESARGAVGGRGPGGPQPLIQDLTPTVSHANRQFKI